MRDTDKTLAAFVTVAAITIITMVVTIGLCTAKYHQVHDRAAASAPVVDSVALAD